MKYIIIYILNLIDYAITVYWTNLHGVSHELNPLMRLALSVPYVFMIIKVFLFPILLFWMWRNKKDDTALIALGMFIAVIFMNFSTVLNYG